MAYRFPSPRQRTSDAEPRAELPRIATPERSFSRDAAAFQSLILINLDAAHNLAWWLTRRDADAADIVQEACMKAWRGFADFEGGDGRAWLLAIVRNTAYTRLRQTDATEPADPTDAQPSQSSAPFAELLRTADTDSIHEALGELSPASREVIVLCDIEGLSYAQIGRVLGVPAGTVMSRVSRARDALRRLLGPRLGKE